MFAFGEVAKGNFAKIKQILSHIPYFSLDTLEWTEVPTTGQIPSSRYAHSFTACEEDRKIFMFGGAAGKYYYSSLYILNTDTLAWTKPVVNGVIPLQRCAHATARVGKKLFIHGGDHGMGQYLDDLHVLDLDDLTFSCPKTTGMKPPARGWHSVTAIGKKLYFFGGCNESRKEALFNDMWILNTETMIWEVPQIYSKCPPPRYSHGAVAVGTGKKILR